MPSLLRKKRKNNIFDQYSLILKNPKTFDQPKNKNIRNIKNKRILACDHSNRGQELYQANPKAPICKHLTHE